MSSEWRKVRLGDVIEFNPRETIKKGTVSKKIGMEKLNSFQRKIEGFEISEYKSGTKFRNGDTLLARITPCLENGKTAQVSILDENEIGFGSTEFIVLRGKQKLTDNDFIYYLAISPLIRDIAIKSMSGTSGRQRAQKDVVENTFIKLPPLEEQKVIANILSSLDEKIELNNQINKTLEEMAQTIFKHWFVDFEFPNESGEPYKSSGGEMVESELGMIPKGWEVGKLEDLVTVKYGKDHKKLEDGDIPVYGSGGVMRYVNKALFSSESVLIPRKGTLNNVIYINEPFWSVDTMFFTQMNFPDIAKYIYFFLKDKDLMSMNSGSAVPSMTTDILNNLSIVIYPLKYIQKYNKLMEPIFSYMSLNKKQIKKLSQLRNTLLPKLLSGEIRVPLKEGDLS